MDSLVEYHFLLSFKQQSYLHFWPLLTRNFEFVFNDRSPTKTAQNFQPITGSLLRSQYVVILTSQKQSKETGNRDTEWQYCPIEIQVLEVTGKYR